jgi:hypothetical protein
MPMNIAYIGDGGILTRGEGVVTGSEIKEVNEIIYESLEKIRKILYQICDLTNVSDTSVSNAEIEELAIQDKEASEINPNMFIAVVCEKDFIFGLARMWEAFTDGARIETMVFRKMEDAQQWIGDKLQKKPQPCAERQLGFR